MNEPVLQVRALTKVYPGVRALDGVDFDVRAGEVHCVIGLNGAGKSTLIKCISGLVAPTSGDVLFNGDRLPVGDPAAALARGIATMYQELDLVPELSVAENVLLGHEKRRGVLLDRDAMRAHAQDLLDRLGHGELPLNAPARSLRPAGQQVVSMARALSHEVSLLIMDEPSAVLDPHEVDALFDVVRRLAEAGVGVIYISHRLEEVARIGDRVTVLRNGQTVASSLAAKDLKPAKLLDLMVGSAVDRAFPARDAQMGDVVLSVRGLTRAPVVTDVSFDVRAGEIVGIAGLVGAGRTELLRAIHGVDPREAGEVSIGGDVLPPMRPDVSVARGMGLAPEERKSQALLMEWSNAANISLSTLGALGVFLDVRRERALAHRYMRDLDTRPDDPDMPTRQLSGGNQQKIVLARWLLRDCRVLLLDEPTRGVDAAARGEIYRVVRTLARTGLAVVVVSSDIGELLGLADRILVLRDGVVVAEHDATAVKESRVLKDCVHTSERKPA